MVVMWSEIALVLVYVHTVCIRTYNAVYMYVHNKHIYNTIVSISAAYC